MRSAIFVDEPERTALRVGLTFAAHIRRLFPEFYCQHVAQRRTTAANLLGVMGAFLSLAHTKLLALDMEAIAITPGGFGGWYAARIPFRPKDPRDALPPAHCEVVSLQLLANEGNAWLVHPAPKVYGVGVYEVTHDLGQGYGRTIGRHALTLAIWQLLGATDWAPLPPERVAELASNRCADQALGQAIAVLPSVPADTPLAPLCAWLDRTKPAKIRYLGTLVAYLCQRTGNPFADVTPTEVRQRYDLVIDMDWTGSATSFAESREEQQAAAAWSRSWSRLSGRFQRERDLLVHIRAALLQGAVAVAGSDMSFGVYQPRALIWRTM